MPILLKYIRRLFFLGILISSVGAGCTSAKTTNEILLPTSAHPDITIVNTASTNLVTHVPTKSATPTPTAQPSNTPSPFPTLNQTQTPKLTPSQTPTQSPAATSIPTYALLRGTVLEQSNCRYGPGAAYLYKYGLYADNNLEIIGRNEAGTWIVVRAIGGTNLCWIKASLMDINGDTLSLAH